MKVTMTLTGFESLQAAIRRQPELVRLHATDAVKVTSFAIAQRARALAPRQTGTLRAAIDTSSRGQSGRVTIGAEAYYWRFVEYGTVRQAAQPFFRPAAENEESAFVDRMRAIGPKLERDWAGGRFV